MKKLLLFVVFLLLSSSVSGQIDDWIATSQYIDMKLHAGSTIDITKNSGSSLDYLNTQLLLFPRVDSRQSVLNIDYHPNPKILSDYLLYSWDEVGESVEFGYDSVLRNVNDRVKISSLSPYPLKDISSDVQKYLKFTENIDTDSDIQSLASDLKSGEADQYKLVFKIAQWVDRNIEYDLNSLTSEASQKASWVLDNRKGVCDELSTLFISLVRSVGIPARYVSGMAYTNFGNLNDWGPHAWAEVYFPDKGWVPFDISYGQFGFIDASHIALKISDDSDSVSTKYELRARNIDIDTHKLDFNVDLVSKNGVLPYLISFDQEILKSEVGFGSYNLIITPIENKADYYYAVTLYLAETDGIETQVNRQQVLLEPNQKKNIYWIVKVNKGLKKGFDYTFPMEVYTQDGLKVESKFSAKEGGLMLSEDDVTSVMDDDVKLTDEKILLKCKAEQSIYYVDQKEAIINCNLDLLEKVSGNICLLSDCRSFSSDSQIEFKIPISSLEVGRKELRVVADYGEKRTDYVELNLQTRPKVLIKDVKSVSQVRYEDTFDVEFVLESVGFPKEVSVILKNKETEKTWEIGDLVGQRGFVLTLSGSQINNGVNNFEIIVNYEDAEGKKYVVNDELSIELTDVTFIQRIKLIFNRFGRWLESLF